MKTSVYNPKKHQHEYQSECCDWPSYGEVDESEFGATGRCGRCHEGAGFYCSSCENLDCDGRTEHE